ncbi:uncharacterized protein LOC135617704 isoform X1 [Musa acuminata AAA Group]|uniref:uncharacterized protein LOC103977488 isoform X1 n=2 Tax=Musa acuminata AAA Group TaxID=214697 RepID=UPI0031E384AA
MRDSHNQLNMIMLENVAAQEESQDHVANTLKRGRQVTVPPDCETEDLASVLHDENKCTEAPYNVLKMIGTVETDTLSISDKTVTQIKVQDNDCQVIKDICVDDGLHAFEKILLKNAAVSENIPSGFKTYATNANDNWNQQMTHGTALVVEGLKYTDAADDDKDQKSSWGLFESKQKLDEGNQLASKTSEKITLQHLFSLGELDTLAHHMVLTSYGSISSTKPSFGQMNIEQVTLEEEHSENLQCDSSMTYESIMILENPNDDLSEGNLEKKCSAATNDPLDVTFSDRNGDSMEKLPNAQLEGVCNSDFNSVAAAAAAAISGTEKNNKNADDKQLVNALYNRSNEEMVFDATTASAQSSFYPNNHGDLHFSGPSYLSGPKVSSGHIAYSGSISLRSESSTTSTHSFAFPILQAEWNTSPIRMVKADRRHLRKYRWRTGLFCCKF